MKLKARVALKLPSISYIITLKYNTFEKAAYDEYLIASLVSNSKTKKQAEKYIEEITGKGSLNIHFRRLYEEISKKSKEEIDSILKNSLFPITKINRDNKYRYYSIFDISQMNGTIVSGNLKNDSDFFKVLMPKDKNSTFISIDFDERSEEIKSENYNAIFSENEIKIELEKNKFYEISKEDFALVYKSDLDDINYSGKIHNSIFEGNWNVLVNSVLKAINNDDKYFIDKHGNHCSISNDSLKKTEITNVLGLYFYKETRYSYTKENIEICNNTIKFLIISGKINEMKTKFLVQIIENADDNLAQRAINYILDIKDSKEIAELGLKLIKNGFENGWNKKTLRLIKRYCLPNELFRIYKIDSSLEFDIDEILNIADEYLTKEDENKKQKYFIEKYNLNKSINIMMGEMTNSGLREKIKKLLNKTEAVKTFKKFADKYIGHSKKDFENMSFDNLKKEYNKIKEIYDDSYQETKKEVAKIYS